MSSYVHRTSERARTEEKRAELGHFSGCDERLAGSQLSEELLDVGPVAATAQWGTREWRARGKSKAKSQRKVHTLP